MKSLTLFVLACALVPVAIQMITIRNLLHKNLNLKRMISEKELQLSNLHSKLKESLYRETVLISKIDSIDKTLVVLGQHELKSRLQPNLLSVNKGSSERPSTVRSRTALNSFKLHEGFLYNEKR